MKDQVFKFLPIVVGVIVGWMMVSPPEFLGLSWFVRIVVFTPILAVLMLLFFMFLISSAMPADIELKRIDQRNVTEAMIDLFNAYRDAGFTLAGAPLRVGTNPPAVLVPMIDESGECYGTIFRTGTTPPKTSCDIVSRLEPEGGLTTGSEPEGASLPVPPGSFFQVFPGADISQLKKRHLEALVYLRSQGLGVKRGSAEAFPGEFKNAISKMRSKFFTNPLWHTLIVVWRSVTKSTPHMGPIHKQAIAQKSLQQLKQQ